MKHRKVRKVAKDKKTGIPKKYLSGVRGSRRAELASVINRISELYKAGKKRCIPSKYGKLKKISLLNTFKEQPVSGHLS